MVQRGVMGVICVCDITSAGARVHCFLPLRVRDTPACAIRVCVEECVLDRRSWYEFELS